MGYLLIAIQKSASLAKHAGNEHSKYGTESTQNTYKYPNLPGKCMAGALGFESMNNGLKEL
jgi:hypothetical protein